MIRTKSRVISWIIALLLAASPGIAIADDMPDNVSDEAHDWLLSNLDYGLPNLIQTDLGPLDPEHIFVVDDLGNWGAARQRGKHQGTDFVIDIPHRSKSGDDRLYVGSIVDADVVHVENNWGAYGNTVFLLRNTAPKMVFIYAHLDRIDVAAGDAVEVGDWLGVFGCSGNCKGLKGKSVQHQVHVEAYSMPDSWDPQEMDWTVLPLRQLRNGAHHKSRRPHGVDVAAYFDDFQPGSITRSGLSEQYAINRDNGGLTTYLDHCEDEYETLLGQVMDQHSEDDVSEWAPPTTLDMVQRSLSEGVTLPARGLFTDT